MKLLSFDLEVARWPEDDNAPKTDLGITCAGLSYHENNGPPPSNQLYYGDAQISKAAAVDLVRDLETAALDGYTIITWNGCGFDFRILAEESGLVERCARLALDSVDMMLFVTFRKGYCLGLDTALAGMHVPQKLHKVTLNDGSILEDMSGKKAPELWAAGEYSAVLDYLKVDIESPIALARKIMQHKAIFWHSQKGRPMSCPVTRFSPVRDLFNLPMPSTSWMTDPPTRWQFIEWMPPDVVKTLPITAPR